MGIIENEMETAIVYWGYIRNNGPPGRENGITQELLKSHKSRAILKIRVLQKINPSVLYVKDKQGSIVQAYQKDDRVSNLGQGAPMSGDCPCGTNAVQCEDPFGGYKYCTAAPCLQVDFGDGL